MKKLLIIICFITISTFEINATEIIFELSKNQKIEGTFSADLNQEKSIHLILTKNKELKNYQIIPFFMDENENTIQLETISTKKNAHIVSYHLNNSNLIFVLENNETKNKQYYVIGYDLITKKQLTKTINKNDDEFIFRLIDKTIIFKKVKNSIEATEILTANNIIHRKTEVNNINVEKFNEIFKSKERPQIINTNEFVKNGSIEDFQVYFENNHFIFSKVNSKNYTVNTFTLNSEDYSHQFKSFKNKELNDIKDLNIYIHNEKLFSISVNKDDALLKIDNLKDGENLSSFSFLKDLNTLLNSEILDNFIKQASKKRNKPTVTINVTKENKMSVNIDYVDVKEYNYNYNWWFHHWMWQQQQWHMQQMMHQQMNNLNIPKGFGPNPELYENIETAKPSKKSIKFVLNNNYIIDKNLSLETKYKDIDRDKYLDPLKENSDLKHITASFQENSLRYLYYSKSLKKFFIKTSKL